MKRLAPFLALILAFAGVVVLEQTAGAATTMIPESVNHTCGANVTAQVKAFLEAQNNPGDVRQLQPNGCYRMDDEPINFTKKNTGLTFDLNGATLKDTTEDVQCGGTGPAQEPCNHSGFIKINKPRNNVPPYDWARGMKITSSNGRGTLRADDAFGDTECQAQGLNSRHCFEHGIEFLSYNNEDTLNITIENLTIDRVHADCIYIQHGTNVQFKNVTCNRAGRQGVGDVGGIGHYYDNIDFVGVHRTCIDFEPNGPSASEQQSHGHDIRNVVFKNSSFSGCGNGAVNAEGYNPWIDHVWFVNNSFGSGGGIKIARNSGNPGGCQDGGSGRRNQFYIVENTFAPGSSGVLLCGMDNDGPYIGSGGSIISDNTFGETGAPVTLRTSGNGDGQQIVIQNNILPNSTSVWSGSGGITQNPFLCRNVLRGNTTPSSCTPRTVPPAPTFNSVTPPPPPSSTVPNTVPGAPVIGTATSADASATVRWTPPTSNGGTAITRYEIYSGLQLLETEPASARSSVITPGTLTNGTSYRFVVKARNAVGLGPASAQSNAVTPTGTIPPTPPTTEPPTTTEPPACATNFCEFLEALRTASVPMSGETISQFLNRVVDLIDVYLA